MKNKKNDRSDPKQKQTKKTDFTLQQNNKNDNRTNRAPAPVLGEKAEDYLREQANIEDMPDEEDEAGL